jgi:transglutaminase-like putative cysteine protease
MRISVLHSSAYRYDRPVHPEPHTFRLRPREDGLQRLLNYSLQISPLPAGTSECLDQDGNPVVEAWFDGPIEQMLVTSAFTVETLRKNPFDFLVRTPTLPPAYPDPLGAALAPYSSRPGEIVREFARGIGEQAGGQTMPFLTALNRTLFEKFRHVVRNDGPPHPPEVTLRQGDATCRDLAVLFCAAARGAGIPARFVSGYEREGAFQDHTYMHAWAEVYLPGGGWRGYDPSQGLAVAGSHVAVAAAADPRLAAPITGAYRGDARSTLEFSISIQVD